MNAASLAVALVLGFNLNAFAEPDLPVFGFFSTLPAGVDWQSGSKLDEGVMSQRQYFDPGRNHTITIQVGRNDGKNDEKDLGRFTEGWKKGAGKNPSNEFISEKKDSIDKTPAMFITGRVNLPDNTIHYIAILVLKGDICHMVTLTTRLPNPENDPLIKSFLDSIRLKAPTP